MAKKAPFQIKKKRPAICRSLLLFQQRLFGCIFKSFHDRENKCGRKDAAYDEDCPQFPQFNLIPQKGSDEKELVTDGCGKKPSTLH